MRVELRMEGGLAVFPGLSGTIHCDSRLLSADEAERLAALVEASGLFAPAAVGSRRRSGRRRGAPAGGRHGEADRRVYSLAIDDGRRRRTVTVEDPLPPKIAALVDFVRRRPGGGERTGSGR